MATKWHSCTFRRLFVGTLAVVVLATLAVTCYAVLWPIWRQRQEVQALVDLVLAEDCDFLMRDWESSEFTFRWHTASDHEPQWVVQRAESVRSLGGARHAVPALVAALRSNDAYVCRKACLALGQLGREASAAASALNEAATDDDESVRRAAKEALEKVAARASGA